MCVNILPAQEPSCLEQLHAAISFPYYRVQTALLCYTPPPTCHREKYQEHHLPQPGWACRRRAWPAGSPLDGIGVGMKMGRAGCSDCIPTLGDGQHKPWAAQTVGAARTAQTTGASSKLWLMHPENFTFALPTAGQRPGVPSPWGCV